MKISVRHGAKGKMRVEKVFFLQIITLISFSGSNSGLKSYLMETL